MNNVLGTVFRSRWAWVAIAAVIAAAAVTWLHGRGSATVGYDTAEISRGDVQTAVASSGAVSPLVTITVGAQVSGIVTQVLVDYNSKVRKDQLLAVIEPSIIESKVRSAEADLAVQTANISSNEVQVATAQVNVDQAKRDYDRTLELSKKNLVSANDLEKARNTWEQDVNAVKVAQAQLANSRALLIKVQAALDQARVDLSHTRILSPVDGVVIERDVNQGQTVQTAMQIPTLFLIAQDLSQIQIETKVDEADIGVIKTAARATFTVDAYPDRSFEGRIAQVRINGTATGNVVTYSVMVQADNPDQSLLPGMTANVKLVTGERDRVLRIPSAALRFRPADAAGAADSNATEVLGVNDTERRVRIAGRPGRPPMARPLVDMTPEVMAQLALSDKQRADVMAALREAVQRARSENYVGGGNPLGGADGGGIRQLMGGGDDAAANRQRMLNALSGVLTDEQLRKYLAMSVQSERAATIYVLNAEGQPQARAVHVGLSDDSYTEVISGLAEGDRVVVRARRAQKG